MIEDEMHVVGEEDSAQLEVSTGDEVVKIDDPGDLLGWSWIFPPYVWHFDARATEPTIALCLSAILLRQHRDEDQALSHELFRRTCEVMVRRLQAARSKLICRNK